VNITVDPKQLKRLQQAIEGTTRKLPNEFATAVNKTAAACKRIMAKQITQQVKVKLGIVKQQIRTKRKATKEDATAEVAIKPTARISLKEFGARQTKAGVTYQIDKKKGTRRTMPGGFIVQSLGGHAFQRIGGKVAMTKGKYAGQMKQRIDKKYGPSPWGVFVKGDAKPPSVEQTREELKKQIDRRIQFINFKKTQG
jgi:hypothetical protein